MPWIKVIKEDEAEGELKEVYRKADYPIYGGISWNQSAKESKGSSNLGLRDCCNGPGPDA